MKYSQKMSLKRSVSAVLAASMAASVFTAVPVYAETSSATYTYDGYKVDYTVTNEWFGNQNVNVTLTNTSSESILNWALGYDANGEISGIWNGYVYSKSDEDYIIKNVGYNYEIEPYQSVNFGYTLSGNELEAPENFELCSKRVDKTEGYDVKLNVTGDWGDSFQAELIVTNTSDAPLEAWKLDFDSNFEITNLWNGKIIESNDDGYSIASCMWTNPIASGESTSIGFTASKETSETPAVSNIKLSEVIIDRSGSVSPDEPVKPSEYELNITADAQYIENDGTAVISWNTSVNNGTFEIMYSEDNIEYIQVASVSDAKTYTYALGDIYGTVYFKVRQTTEGGQVAESSALSVDIPVPVVPEKPVVTLSAEYDKETGYVNVLWETTVEGGNFDIYVSVDSGEFEKKASVSDTVSYSFAPEVSGSYDIKIVQTTAAGMTGESSVVNVVCTIPDPAEDIDWEDETDSDEDGISDVYETYIYFTDPHNPDTDSDGIPDGYEVFTLDTDPLSSDTDVNGVSDGDEDIDGDGLNNLREFELGTDPRDVDSDDDGLSDADEINIYKTDPLKYDTDDDGVSDGDEVALKLDPTNASTDGTPDNERTFKQVIPADDWLFYNINIDNSPVEVSIELDAAGVALNNIEASFSGYSYSMHNDAIIGVAPEFSYNDKLKINDVKINFDIDSSIINDYNNTYDNVSEEFTGIKRFNVFRYFEDNNMLLPIETFHDVENNRVYAHYDEMGTYCLIDMTKWLDSLGYMSNADQSVMAYAMNEISPKSDSIDIVFLMYVLPSQSTFIKEELVKVVNTVYDNAGDVNMYFMINDGTDVIPYMISGKTYAENKTEALSITNRLNFPLSNPVYLYKGFKAVSELTLRDDAQKHLFLIDGVFEPKTDTENVFLKRILDKNVNFGVVCDVVNSNLAYYRSISEGNVKNSHIVFSSFITDQISFPIDTEKDYIITSNGLMAIPENFGKISADSTQDYDEDGLPDVTEINFNALAANGKKLVTVNADNSVVLPSFNECTAVAGTYVEEGVKRFYDEADNSVLELLDEIKVLPLKSSPVNEDSDRDGIEDADEYKIEFTNLLNGTEKIGGKLNNIFLRPNNLIDTYNFNTSIKDLLDEDGNIYSVYSLAKEKGITSLNEEKDSLIKYGYLGTYNDNFFLEACCEFNSDGTVKSNLLRINANVKFENDSLKLLDSYNSQNKHYSKEFVTKEEIIDAIQKRWSKEINGTIYDFYRMKVNLSTVLHEVIDSTDNMYMPVNYSKIFLCDSDGKATTGLLLDAIKNVKIYNSRNYVCQDKAMIFDTCSHEFGHIVGLADIYGNSYNNYIQPVPYVDLSEVSFKPDAHKGDKDSNALMYMSGNLSANEVEMTIYAAKEKKPQFFVPKGTVKTKEKEIVYNQSSAIKYKYFYQCVDDHCEFENIKKGDFLFYSKGEFTKINTKSQDELKSYVKISYNTYYSLFKKCYGDVPLNMIEISYQDYCDLQDKYVVTVYNHIHKP